MDYALSFDDVLLLPAESSVLPNEVDTSTFITNKIKINIPMMSAAMDTVTESAMAIAMARFGGIGCVHRNLSIEDQVQEIRLVKKCEGWIVYDPITVYSHESVNHVIDVMRNNNYSGIPVICKDTQTLVGVVTNRDVRFLSKQESSQPIHQIMTKDLITVKEGISKLEAIKLFHKYKIERLIVVDSASNCVGLITVKDVEQSSIFPNACKDEHGRLRVAGAIGIGINEIDRASALIAEGVDLLVIDTAHGHSKAVRDAVIEIKRMYPDAQVIGGNVATKEAADFLIEAGVDGVKVGIGPGSICTTRIVTGVGVPQLHAITEVAKVCKEKNIRLIADGGIRFSGDISKALGSGADAVMIGSLLAGTDESPGEFILHNGRSYKCYQGMGSISSMERGFSNRYSQSKSKKFVPEGVEGRVPCSGPVQGAIYQLIGGLRSAMGYTGNSNILEMKTRCKFVPITPSGMRESHAHDVIITRESPNYARGFI